jgi:hypothetical protein
MTTKTDYSNKFRIKKINDINILHIKDIPVECIYKSPVMLPHQNIQGQLIIKQTLCSDLCPMFIYLKDGLFNNVNFKCTNHTIDVYEESSFLNS